MEIIKQDLNIKVRDDGVYILETENYRFHLDEKTHIEKIGKLINEIKDLEKENEQLKEVLGSILIKVRRDISATNHSGEVKAFVNPNSFDLISEVLRKYGALKDWYE